MHSAAEVIRSGEVTRGLAPIEGGLTVIGSPQQILKQHQEVADLLMRFVEERELFQQIGKNKHILIEAWQFCAHFYGITAKERHTEPYVDEISGAAGFKSTADVVMIHSSQVISSASALCLNNEDNWNERPKYKWENNNRTQIGTVRVPSQQLASMAQTRAISKALSNVLRFVVVLAGFSSTPAEEMTGDETDRREEKPPGREPERKSEQRQANSGEKITEPQRKRLFAIAHEVSCPMNTLAEFWIKAGFDIAANITKGRYDEIVESVRNWQSAAPAQQAAGEKK